MSEVVEVREIEAAMGPIDAVVELPGSKSYTNRALLIGALAHGTTTITRALFSDDTRYMTQALRHLGVSVQADEPAETIVVEGTGGTIQRATADLFVGNAGTAARFLTALVALGNGTYRLDGVPRMRERPIGPLLDALRQLGATVTSERGNECLPITIQSRGLDGGTVTIRGDVSSQFISALLMIGPVLPRGIEVAIRGELVSRPYVELTLDIMSAFGASAERVGDQVFHVPGGAGYVAREYAVEPDASGASYFFAAAALTGGRVRVLGLGQRSAQGDLGLVDVLEQMGCAVVRGDDWTEVRGPERLRGVDVDMGSMSDVAQTIAAIAPFADGPVRVRGIAHARLKETDRVAAVATELRRLGVSARELPDGWEIKPSQPRPAVIETYDDHRMAMSFAVTGLRVPGLRIANPSCVAKTFPDFFERFEQLRKR